MSKFKFPRKIFIFVVSTIIIAGIIFLNYQKAPLSIRGFANGLFSPVQKFLYRASNQAAGYLSALFSASSLSQENQLLEKQNLELKSQISQLIEFSRENKILKEQLDLKLLIEDANNYVFSNVIGYSPDNLSHYFLIDKGSRDGVEKDSAVIISGNILVGKIIEVFSSTAKVLLISDSNSSIGALTQKNRISGAVRGEWGSEIFLEMIPQDENIEKGEQVITAGFGRNFPKGLIIGEISEIIANDVEAFKKAKIQLMNDLSKIESVFVISNP
ncbi:MAG: Cell shape-determining protein MreC [Parcubacteria group bacterium GW2011_GWF2_39_13b]|nr:MAG: Cell shape-determining protein MreC [Parcubacteria group bacterium GW2011_GWF2_39_13b]